MEEVSLLLEINRLFPKEREWDEYEIFIRNGYIRNITDSIAPSPTSGKLLTPQWAIDKGNEIGSQNKSDLVRSNVKIVGDIESLDSAKVPVGEPAYPTYISIEVVAQAMLAFDKTIVKKFPIDWVQRNVLGRYKRKLKKEYFKFRKKL
jgi:ABC-type sulfate transport system substrate-binding protein